MACTLWNICKNNINGPFNSVWCGSVRCGHHLRGKPPGIAKSLEEKLLEKKKKDPVLSFRVDIGFPIVLSSRSKKLDERLKVLKEQRKNTQLEKLARTKSLLVDLNKVRQEWLTTCASSHIKERADHFGIFEHLYGDAYFHPTVPLNVSYTQGDIEHPVFFGNTIKPKDAQSKPEISYESDSKTLWSLILTNPDGHFTEHNKEYVHWFLGNIPGNKISSGETLIDYLQPFPPKGTGFHRLVFVLYKQNQKIDFTNYKKNGKCLNLSERTFSTYEFYKKFQDDLTPAGLAFFQSDWDSSLKEFYHNILEIKEPVFEYDFPDPYIRKQEWFPLRKPFNLYMDKYRDPKEINKEFLQRKLKNSHPFKTPPPPVPYPNAQNFSGYIPSWLKLEKTKSRLGWGRINDIK
ncbi:unnamed protein product [Brassicogethes aeneus]|uniref:Large ribosomal subunit protein mL38 n=1 Tax=Brassicogethes aeneus TaxID=1431903 RepID=A0A9P0AT06_BRAAE|nr:unnamed protein product [Brassicogethes aeneus]